MMKCPVCGAAGERMGELSGRVHYWCVKCVSKFDVRAPRGRLELVRRNQRWQWDYEAEERE